MKDTKKLLRKKMVDDARAISLLDAGEPTEETKKLAEDFVNGIIQLDEMKKLVLKRYIKTEDEIK